MTEQKLLATEQKLLTTGQKLLPTEQELLSTRLELLMTRLELLTTRLELLSTKLELLSTGRELLITGLDLGCRAPQRRGKTTSALANRSLTVAVLLEGSEPSGRGSARSGRAGLPRNPGARRYA